MSRKSRFTISALVSITTYTKYRRGSVFLAQTDPSYGLNKYYYYFNSVGIWSIENCIIEKRGGFFRSFFLFLSINEGTNLSKHYQVDQKNTSVRNNLLSALTIAMIFCLQRCAKTL